MLTARGPDVLEDLAGLPAERRARHGSLAVVAAAAGAQRRRPADRGAGLVVDDPASRLDGPEGVETLLTNADAVARVLVDLLGWETDA